MDRNLRSDGHRQYNGFYHGCLGLIPVQDASAPAVSAARIQIAEQTGANAVAATLNRRTPQTILSAESFYNAATVLQAIGGSTNAVVHLIAIINRHPGVKGSINLNTLDDIGRRTPLLVDLKSSGDNYLNDFHNAGDMLCLLHLLQPLLHLSAKTITGESLGEFLDRNAFRDFEYSLNVIRTLSDPLHMSSSLIVVEGQHPPQRRRDQGFCLERQATPSPHGSSGGIRELTRLDFAPR